MPSTFENFIRLGSGFPWLFGSERHLDSGLDDSANLTQYVCFQQMQKNFGEKFNLYSKNLADFFEYLKEREDYNKTN